MDSPPNTDATPDTDAPDTDAPDTDAPDTDAPDSDTPDTDTPDTHLTPVDSGSCATFVLHASPAAGATGIAPNTTVRFDLSDTDPAATLSLTSPAGSVAGTTSRNGDTIVFTPDAQLAPLTTYTATLDYSCGLVQVGWTTSNVGAPVGGHSLVGRSYTTNLNTGNFVEPPGVGVLLQSILDIDMLFEVLNYDAPSATLQLRIGLSAPTGGQDTGAPTSDGLELDFSDNPSFSFSTTDLVVPLDGFQVELAQMDLEGLVTPAGDEFVGISIRAEVDTRGIVDLLVPGGADDAACMLLGQLGAPACQPCTDGTGSFCVITVVEDMTATDYGNPVVPVAGGGCSTTGGLMGLAGLVLLPALLRRRER